MYRKYMLLLKNVEYETIQWQDLSSRQSLGMFAF